MASQDDGSFQIVVPPGKGHLLVFGPTPDYILEVIGARMLYERPARRPAPYAHEIIPYEVKAGDRPRRDRRRAPAGQDGQGPRASARTGRPVDDAAIIATAPLRATSTSTGGATMLPVHARDGRFELHGLDPEKAAPVSFLDADHEWGTTVELSGKQAGEEVTVRLQPCGQAKARFVGPDGKPVARRVFPTSRSSAPPGRATGSAGTGGRRPSWRPTRPTCPTSTPSTTGQPPRSPTPTAASPCPT